MIEILLPRTDDPERLRLRLLLLFGQALAVGLIASLIVITGSSLFLPLFGSRALPYTYLLVALSGSLVSYGSAVIIRRWSLPRAAIGSTSGLALFLLAGWFAMSRGEAHWVPFALMVAFHFNIQVGFVFLGGQAGRLLDVRQIKRFFPQIVAGFVAGFVLGGLAMPLLVSLLGSTQNVLLAIAAVTFNLVAFMVATNRSFPAAFRRDTGGPRRETSQTLPRLLTRRYVLLVVVYQMLGAMTIQLTEYILMAQAAARYLDSQALAHFFSQFYVVLNGLDLFVLLVVASLFLRRFGLSAGLLANPLVTALLFGGMVLLGLMDGSTSALFFFLVSAGRILNVTLEDGATRTSLNAAYQVLPGEERSLVQTAVEGIGAPLALGLVGLLLILFNQLGGLNILYVMGLTVALAIMWALTGSMVYRGYAASLLKSVRRRTLGEAELSLDDGSSLEVVERLLQSDQPHQVSLALDMLQMAEHSSLDDHLLRLAEHSDPSIQLRVLSALEERRLKTALPAAGRLLVADRPAEVTAAALVTFCSLAESEAVDRVIPFLAHSQPVVRHGAMVGLLRYGGIPGVMAAGRVMQQLEKSNKTTDRILLAQVIGAVKAASLYQPLSGLLQDEAAEVRRAALDAAAQLKHPRLLEQVLANLADSRTRSAASAALVAYGPVMVPLVAQALTGELEVDQEQTRRLVRLCGQVGGAAAIDLLAGYLDHPKAGLRQEILAALSLCGFRAGAGETARVHEVMRQEAQAAAEILAARADIGDGPELEALQAALEEELAQARHRLFLLLSFLYDSGTMLRAEAQLERRDASQRAMVLELLDLQLSAGDKGVIFPLIDPRLDIEQRLKQLEALMPVRLGSQPRVRSIITAEHTSWPFWARACAIYAAGRLGWEECADAVAAAVADKAFVVQETAVWALSRLAPARLQQIAAGLEGHEDPRIVELVRQLRAAGDPSSD